VQKQIQMSNTKYIPRLRERYQSQIIPALMKQFNYTSSNAGTSFRENLLEPRGKRSHFRQKAGRQSP
jgi:hypothetical protein